MIIICNYAITNSYFEYNSNIEQYIQKWYQTVTPSMKLDNNIMTIIGFSMVVSILTLCLIADVLQISTTVTTLN